MRVAFVFVFFSLFLARKKSKSAANWSSGSKEESDGPERLPDNGTELETTLGILKG